MRRSYRLDILDDIRIARACHADWEKMSGDERTRFCGDCRKNVYNLSGLSRQEALDLLEMEDEVCMRIYRRRDGTVLTADCKGGTARVRARRGLAAGLAAGALGAAGFFSAPATAEMSSPAPIPQEDHRLMMGEIEMSPEVLPVATAPKEKLLPEAVAGAEQQPVKTPEVQRLMGRVALPQSR